MIRIHCDICNKEMSVYQAVKIESMTVHSNDPPYAPPRMPQVFTFDTCSAKCFDEALSKLRQQVRQQGTIR